MFETMSAPAEVRIESTIFGDRRDDVGPVLERIGSRAGGTREEALP